MSSGSSRHKKVASNLIDFFNTHNSDTQAAFEEVFGPNSLLYKCTNKRRKRYQKQYKGARYSYRIKENALADISHEFFRFLRSSDLQDKWAIEIIRLMDGDRTYIKGFDE